MSRYLFEYAVANGTKGEFSIVADNEKEARKLALIRVADFEFVEESEVEINDLIKVLEVTNNYFECEGCQ